MGIYNEVIEKCGDCRESLLVYRKQFLLEAGKMLKANMPAIKQALLSDQAEFLSTVIDDLAQASSVRGLLFHEKDEGSLSCLAIAIQTFSDLIAQQLKDIKPKPEVVAAFTKEVLSQTVDLIYLAYYPLESEKYFNLIKQEEIEIKEALATQKKATVAKRQTNTIKRNYQKKKDKLLERNPWRNKVPEAVKHLLEKKFNKLTATEIISITNEAMERTWVKQPKDLTKQRFGSENALTFRPTQMERAIVWGMNKKLDEIGGNLTYTNDYMIQPFFEYAGPLPVLEFRNFAEICEYCSVEKNSKSAQELKNALLKLDKEKKPWAITIPNGKKNAKGEPLFEMRTGTASLLSIEQGLSDLTQADVTEIKDNLDTLTHKKTTSIKIVLSAPFIAKRSEFFTMYPGDHLDKPKMLNTSKGDTALGYFLDYIIETGNDRKNFGGKADIPFSISLQKLAFKINILSYVTSRKWDALEERTTKLCEDAKKLGYLKDYSIDKRKRGESILTFTVAEANIYQTKKEIEKSKRSKINSGE